MNPATPNTIAGQGVVGDSVLGYLLSTNVKSNAPQQFNIPTMVKGGGISDPAILPDTTSPYLGVFNR